MVRFPVGIHAVPPVPPEWMSAEGADLLGGDWHVLGAAEAVAHSSFGGRSLNGMRRLSVKSKAVGVIPRGYPLHSWLTAFALQKWTRHPSTGFAQFGFACAEPPSEVRVLLVFWLVLHEADEPDQETIPLADGIRGHQLPIQRGDLRSIDR